MRVPIWGPCIEFSRRFEFQGCFRLLDRKLSHFVLLHRPCREAFRLLVHPEKPDAAAPLSVRSAQPPLLLQLLAAPKPDAAAAAPASATSTGGAVPCSGCSRTFSR